jgi:hypothetical protein
VYSEAVSSGAATSNLSGRSRAAGASAHSRAGIKIKDLEYGLRVVARGIVKGGTDTMA